jgi:environmental stress-induced protein Ves
MEATIINSSEYKTTKWSGGTTTELFIFPQTANYRSKIFDFRISSATVEDEKSDFTVLPNILRKLMILEGEITIMHKNKYTKKLHKFDVDCFEGSWETSSVGKCTDFNVMTKNNIISDLSSVVCAKNQMVNIENNENFDWLFMYLNLGTVNFQNQNTVMRTGDFLAIQMNKNEKVLFTGVEKSELIFTKIKN